MSFKAALLTDIGKVRRQNEDFIDSEKTANATIFILCDGMGGHVGGAVASQTAAKALKSFFIRKKDDHIPELMYQAFVFANDAIQSKVEKQPELRSMGTTAVVLFVADDLVYYGHIGDSRLYLLRDNKLVQLTRDHSYVQTLIDKGLLTEDDAKIHPQRNRITRVLGTRQEIDPEVCDTPITTKAGDIFLLCSDGLNGMISDEDMAGILRSNLNVQEKADALVQAANEAGGIDNISVIIVSFE
jgi:PPM family protein phosphatase